MLSWLFPTWSQPAQIPSASTDILAEPLHHPALTCLRDLVVVGGGGAWPPRATYRDSWPLPLRAYDTAFRAMEPSFPVKESSTDNSHNRKLIDSFRSRMRAQLDQHVNMGDVLSALERAESDSESCSQGAWLGYWLCISFLRHSYRWGVTPIVSEAQNEVSLDFPHQLDVPWSYIQRHFGVTSPGGCMTSLMYSNLRADDHLEYSVTVGMPEDHHSTEYWNTKLIVSMEERALPMYHLFARAIAFVDAGDMTAAADTLKSANDVLKLALKFFFTTMVDATLAQSIWLAYVQGYQGWTLGGIDGISGGQSLTFRTLDSFLGIRPFPEPEKESLHLPTVQRDWLNFLRKYDIRAAVKAHGEDGTAVAAELEALVKQLRLWRMGHMRRMQPYESVHRPERMTMTSGISVVNASDENEMIKHLKRQLGQRLAQTV
ncbi:hypothetical protein DFH08DRAFT_904417 [Mycena albidolilacea]|uniref:Indoleamine 2,3-dioxygenase n=1 Tax=Mycena albidolilacea TaxID=1033008 RepID=A0AAD6Z0W2_9AGAR|nr:hypothetical protein DFH08DRAFT_904417 [Mycena albidolilacea]